MEKRLIIPKIFDRKEMEKSFWKTKRKNEKEEFGLIKKIRGENNEKNREINLTNSLFKNPKFLMNFFLKKFFNIFLFIFL